MMRIRLFNLAAAMVVLVFVALIVSGLLVPIYADEVSTKMTQATVFLNDGRMLTAIPQCLPELTMRIPASWYPAAAIYQGLYSGLSPLMIRVSGVIFALLFVFVAALGLRRVVPGNLPYWPLLAGFVAVLGLGVLPFTLVLSRSEQWFLLLLTYFVFFPLLDKKGGVLFSGLHALVFVTCTSLLFYTHPKAAFFTPVVIVSGLIAFRGRRWLQILAAAFAIVCLTQSVLAANELFSCENAPIIAAAFSKQTSSLSVLVVQPVGLMLELGGNLLTFPKKVIDHSVFQVAYQSFWLPSVPVGHALDDLVRLVNSLIAGCLLLVIALGLTLPLVAFVFARILGSLGDFHFLTGALWFSLVAHLAIYRTWNFYGGILVIGILVLLIALSLRSIPWSKHWRKGGNGVLVSLFAAFLLSALVLVTSVMPRLMNRGEAHHFGVPGQPLSVPTFTYPAQREKIRGFASSCGLEGDGARRLVIDDLTYFAFDGLREPMHLVYISESGMGPDIKGGDLIGFLNRMASPGVIAQCTFLPPAVRQYAMEDGNLCCVMINSK